MKVNNGIKQTEIGLIPEDWEIAKLGDVMEEVNIRVKDLDTIDAEEIPILSLTKNYGLIPQSQRFHKRIATEDVSNYKVIRKWQVVYNPYVIWEGAIHTLRKMDIGIVSPVYIVWKFKDNVDPSFMDYLLRTPLLLNSYLSRASGVVNRRRSISKTDFLNIPIPLPPLSEQQKIAKVLDTIQRAIEIQDRIIETTKNLKKSLMQRLFREGTKGEELKETETGLIPKSWKVVRLGEVADFKNGINFSKEQKGTQGILTVDVLNMYSEGIYLNFENLYRVDVNLENDSDYILKIGDILIVRSSLKREGVGWASLFGGWEEPVTFCGFIIRIRLNNISNILPEYLTYFLRSEIAREELIKASGQVAITNITQGALKSLKIPRPSLPEQQGISSILSTIDRKIKIEQRRKDLLKQLFKTMLHKLMSGEIRLWDVEI